MILTIRPAAVAGTLNAPPSKSCTQRALAAALLTPGKSVIERAGRSNDEMAARHIIESLGARISEENDTVIVTSDAKMFQRTFRVQAKQINCGESGLSMRMFAPIASLFDYDITLVGSGSILSRPMDFLDTYLPQLGVSVHSNGGKLPVTLRGPLKPRDITVDGALSSQFLTGLLFAFCGAAKHPVTIRVKDLTSRPYIDLTISVLEQFGFRVHNCDYEAFNILPVHRTAGAAVRYTVEGDWSNAAFILVAGAVAGQVTLSGMDLNSTQGDKKIMEALYDCKADVKIGRDGISVRKVSDMSAFRFDATQCPDLFPPLVALAANCSGVSHIRGVNRLLHKESNRAIALRDEFGKMNVRVDIDDDVMMIHGSDRITGASVSSHNDHRIAMAATVAALNASKPVKISGAEAVNKSYPGFYDDMRSLGTRISS